MNEYGQLLEDGALRFTRLLPGPVERVWQWLVDPEKRSQWLAGGETASEPGGKIVLAFDNAALTPHDDPITEKYKDMDKVSFDGEILLYEPPHRFAFSWPDRDGGYGEVWISLSDHEGGVKLELIHKGISHRDDLIGASAGWHRHLDIMADRLADKIPGPFWALHEKLEEEYRSHLP